jgi:hypothetical protein
LLPDTFTMTLGGQKMTNDKVIERFLNGATYGASHTKNLYIEGNRLVNYYTTIAERVSDGVVVNVTKYSVTTSKIQSSLLSKISQKGVQSSVVRGLKIGAYTLV